MTFQNYYGIIITNKVIINLPQNAEICDNFYILTKIRKGAKINQYF